MQHVLLYLHLRILGPLQGDIEGCIAMASEHRLEKIFVLLHRGYFAAARRSAHNRPDGESLHVPQSCCARFHLKVARKLVSPSCVPKVWLGCSGAVMALDCISYCMQACACACVPALAEPMRSLIEMGVLVMQIMYFGDESPEEKDQFLAPIRKLPIVQASLQNLPWLSLRCCCSCWHGFDNNKSIFLYLLSLDHSGGLLFEVVAGCRTALGSSITMRSRAAWGLF